MDRMTWRRVKGKYVICKNGVYLSLKNDNEINELRLVLDDIQSGDRKLYLEDFRMRER